MHTTTTAAMSTDSTKTVDKKKKVTPVLNFSLLPKQYSRVTIYIAFTLHQGL